MSEMALAVQLSRNIKLAFYNHSIKVGAFNFHGPEENWAVKTYNSPEVLEPSFHILFSFRKKQIVQYLYSCLS